MWAMPGEPCVSMGIDKEHRVYMTDYIHCPDSARIQGANERVVLCLMNDTTSKSSVKCKMSYNIIVSG